eukprot:5270544-Pyramimonas_sp.AAC.1
MLTGLAARWCTKTRPPAPPRQPSSNARRYARHSRDSGLQAVNRQRAGRLAKARDWSEIGKRVPCWGSEGGSVDCAVASADAGKLEFWHHVDWLEVVLHLARTIWESTSGLAGAGDGARERDCQDGVGTKLQV